MAAYKRADEWGDKIPIGILYEAHDMTYEERDSVMKTPLIKQPITKLTEEDLQEFY